MVVTVRSAHPSHLSFYPQIICTLQCSSSQPASQPSQRGGSKPQSLVSRPAVHHPSPRRRAHVKLVSAACEARALSPARHARGTNAKTQTRWITSTETGLAQAAAGSGRSRLADCQTSRARLGDVPACTACLLMSRGRGVQEAGGSRVRHTPLSIRGPTSTLHLCHANPRLHTHPPTRTYLEAETDSPGCLAVSPVDRLTRTTPLLFAKTSPRPFRGHTTVLPRAPLPPGAEGPPPPARLPRSVCHQVAIQHRFVPRFARLLLTAKVSFPRPTHGPSSHVSPPVRMWTQVSSHLVPPPSAYVSRCLERTAISLHELFKPNQCNAHCWRKEKNDQGGRGRTTPVLHASSSTRPAIVL